MRYLFFDTETTGLLANSLMPIERQPYITELFMLIAEEDGTEVSTWHSLIKPPVALTDEIVRITGITDAMLFDQPSFADLATTIATYMDEADTLVAHNLKYDHTMLKHEFQRAGIAPPWVEHQMELICTVEATEHLRGYRLNLTKLHELLFGEKFDGAHRAEADVRATAKCFFEGKRKGLL